MVWIKTGIKLDGEVKGTLNPFVNWSAVSLGQIAMGHEVGVTAIQLAMAYCAIANGGYLLQPKLIRQVIDSQNLSLHIEEPVIIRKIANESTMHDIKKMLRNVILNGTGVNAEISGWKVLVKLEQHRNGLMGNIQTTSLFRILLDFPSGKPSIIIFDNS